MACGGNCGCQDCGTRPRSGIGTTVTPTLEEMQAFMTGRTSIPESPVIDGRGHFEQQQREMMQRATAAPLPTPWLRTYDVVVGLSGLGLVFLGPRNVGLLAVGAVLADVIARRQSSNFDAFMSGLPFNGRASA